MQMRTRALFMGLDDVRSTPPRARSRNGVVRRRRGRSPAWTRREEDGSDMWASAVSGTEREEGRAAAGPARTELGRLREGWAARNRRNGLAWRSGHGRGKSKGERAAEDGPAEAREE